jgi:phosphatidylglycerol---prolipoprotein diacylglyceryl transferase
MEPTTELDTDIVSFDMSLYGLIIGIAIVVAISLFEKRNSEIPKNLLNRFYLGLLVSMLVGARAYHVFDYGEYYQKHLAEVFYTWNGGLGIYGALMGGIIFVYIFCKLRKISFINIFNQIALILPLAQAMGRLGNWVNSENPLWWEEALLNLMLFIFLTKSPQNAGAKYLIGYGLIRMVTEYFRTDTWVAGGVKVASVISIFFIGIGLLLIYGKARKKV